MICRSWVYQRWVDVFSLHGFFVTYQYYVFQETDSNNFKTQLKVKDDEIAGVREDMAKAKEISDSKDKDAENAADAQLKAKDKAHAVAMGGLRGELYGKYEEERLKALEEASAARGKVEEEKSKLETDLQELGLSKVI